MGENYFTKIDLGGYLRDLGRTSGSVLSWVESEPERYGAWLAGKTDDRQTPAKGRGSYVHARLLEPETVPGTFAFYPSRAEATDPVMEEVIGPRGGKKMAETGSFQPQDSSPAGRYKSAFKKSDHQKAQVRAFLDGAVGRTIVYPEVQPLSEAMIRAVARHPEAADLLAFDADFGPEVTGHYTCPVTGEPMRIRPDAIRLKARKWIEIKTVEPRTGERLDTLSPSAVDRWARAGWARKSAMLHDGCRAITGDNWTGHWIIIEAIEDDPRVSVVPDHDEEEGSMSSLGRLGDGDEIRGYIELIQRAQQMRASKDFRHECVRGVQGWRLPEYRTTKMQFHAASMGEPGPSDGIPVPPVLGATPLGEYDGT